MNKVNLDIPRPVASNVSAPANIELRSTIDLLRARTATHHHELESGLQIQNRLSEIETRSPLIAGYFAFHREAEAALRPHLWDMSDLAFSSRVHFRRTPGKTGLLSNGMFLIDRVFPVIETKAEALGALYVVEGSTLGGKKILKALRSHGVSTDDLHFLDPYGNDTRAYWCSFLRVLEHETAHQQSTMNACVSGAMKAFSFAAICLREERTN
jgi:heme oxygenase